jgi:hypothetical protein
MANGTSSPLIIGGSVAGLALAGAFAQKFRDRQVTLISQPIKENRRLIAGCSLRPTALALMAKAVDCPLERLVGDLAGGTGSFSNVSSGVGCQNGDRIRFHRPVNILMPSPIRGLSTRHSRILSALRNELNKFPNLEIIEKSVRNLGEVQHLVSDGRQVINATPTLDIGKRSERHAPKKYVVAVQIPCRKGIAGLQPPLRSATAYASLIRFSDGVHLAFFTPFFDPLTSSAEWYGINTKIVDADLIHEGGEEVLLKPVRRGLELMAESLGLEFVDPEETEGGSVIAINSCDSNEFHSREVYDAYYGFESGAPAIAADGMYAMVTGATAYVRALSESQSIDPAVDQALRGIRQGNRMCQSLMKNIPVAVTQGLISFFPGLFVKRLQEGWIPN